MNEINTFLFGLGISLAVVFGAAIYLRRPLFTLLTELCGTEDRARFWTQITMLSFILVGGLMAFTFSPANQLPAYYFISKHLARTLGGLVVVIIFLSLTIASFIRRQDQPALKLQQGGQHAK